MDSSLCQYSYASNSSYHNQYDALVDSVLNKLVGRPVGSKGNFDTFVRKLCHDDHDTVDGILDNIRCIVSS